MKWRRQKGQNEVDVLRQLVGRKLMVNAKHTHILSIKEQDDAVVVVTDRVNILVKKKEIAKTIVDWLPINFGRA